MEFNLKSTPARRRGGICRNPESRVQHVCATAEKMSPWNHSREPEGLSTCQSMQISSRRSTPWGLLKPSRTARITPALGQTLGHNGRASRQRRSKRGISVPLCLLWAHHRGFLGSFSRRLAKWMDGCAASWVREPARGKYPEKVTAAGRP